MSPFQVHLSLPLRGARFFDMTMGMATSSSTSGALAGEQLLSKQELVRKGHVSDPLEVYRLPFSGRDV